MLRAHRQIVIQPRLGNVEHVVQSDKDIDPLEHVSDQRDVQQIKCALEEEVIFESALCDLSARVVYRLVGKACNVADDASEHADSK